MIVFCFFYIFLVFAQSIDCRYGEAVLSSHYLCFGSKIRKIVYYCSPQFYYIKVGYKGVNISRTCFPDVFHNFHMNGCEDVADSQKYERKRTNQIKAKHLRKFYLLGHYLVSWVSLQLCQLFQTYDKLKLKYKVSTLEFI